MTTKDLCRFIIDNGYPYDLVHFIEKYPNEAFCIHPTPYGKWEVYYSQKGQKSGLSFFENESDACKYLLFELKKEDSSSFH